MKTMKPPLSPAEMRQQAAEWYARQIDVLQRCHGNDWPDNRQWIEEYLKEELRQRLIAVGWRPKA